ncbi:MAG: sugar metabolism transcriptional regulator [Comamonadaceae bacterium]|nr:sugar metabolism transcriptional regulator [Comamonadaceae bacterium]
MLISQLSSYLQQHQRASVQDMALHLDSSTEAVQAMLDLLQRKQRVRRLGDAGSSCGKCGGCGCSSPASPAYEWVASPTP